MVEGSPNILAATLDYDLNQQVAPSPLTCYSHLHLLCQLPPPALLTCTT